MGKISKKKKKIKASERDYRDASKLLVKENCSNLEIYKDDLNIFISKVNNYFKKLKYVNKFM